MNSYELAKAQKALESAGYDADAIPLSQQDDGTYGIDLGYDNVVALPQYVGQEVSYQFNTGDKFPGGFGATQINIPDYWTLRARSAQLFTTNHYARGIIRCLVTSIINTGLHPEYTPPGEIVGRDDEYLEDLADLVETRFDLWGQTPDLCDHQRLYTFAALERIAYVEALVEGDVLVVLRENPVGRLPQVQLISGRLVTNPVGDRRAAGKTIEYGVELDDQKRHVAFWVQQELGGWERIPAVGARSGRRLAWLHYGTDKRKDAVRGEPMLSIMLQALHELDKYRDAAMRKTLLNSLLAMFIRKTQDKPGSLPVTGAAVRKGTQVAGAPGTDEQRRFRIQEYMPGMIVEELQQGEEPVPGQSGAEIQLGPFEELITQSLAWCLEIPPEVLRKSFSSNYSASQAANNEFALVRNKERQNFGQSFCQPVFADFLLSDALNGTIRERGILESWRNPAARIELAAWMRTDWSGAIKPSVDPVKTYRGYEGFIKLGAITHDRASREITGTKFTRNVKKLRKENELLVAAFEPVTTAQQNAGGAGPDIAGLAARLDEIAAMLDSRESAE